jgi:hypothetical protein
LDYYVARWYDPSIAHFVQADSEAPQLGQSQTFDRYLYANQNPIRYNDPTGHDAGCMGMDCGDLPSNYKPPVYIPPTPTTPEPPNPYPWWKYVSPVIHAAVEFSERFSVTITKSVETIPVLIPRGLGVAEGIVDYGISHPTGIRAITRTEGDAGVVDPVLGLLGVGLTLAPEQIQDFRNQATWERHTSDALIDLGGYGASEILGGVLGVAVSLSWGPEAGIPAALAVTAGTSLLWDNAAASGNWRNNFPGTIDNITSFTGEALNYFWEGPSIDPNSPSPSPVPTP